MKYIFFLSLLSLLPFQTKLLAQEAPHSTPQLEVRVQTIPNQNKSLPQVGVQGNSGSFRTIDHMKSQEVERTLSIIKPDAVKNRHIGDILSRFEDKGLRIVGIRMVNLNKEQAAKFYHIHRDRPFFPELVDFMSSGPIVVMVLEGDHAIAKNREIMGTTNPKNAAPGTIRADFAKSMSQNAVHGSDSPEAAREEIQFFFKPSEIYSQK